MILSACSEKVLDPIDESVPSIQAYVTGNAGSPDIVISQIFTGNGAAFSQDYIELFNRGTTVVSLNGWSLQHAAGFSRFMSNYVKLSGTLAPGQYYLVAMGAPSPNGASLPRADLSAVFGLSFNSGKIILANVATGINCNGGATAPCSSAQQAQIIDLLGYGSTDYFEGSGPAPSPALTRVEALFRKNGGCTDGNSNVDDFETGTPAPRNMSSLKAPCQPVQRPPVAVLSAASSSAEGSSVSFSGAGSSDPDNDALTYSWNFGDGSSASGLNTAHTFTQDGSYTVTLKVTDVGGLFATATQTVTVSNVAPAVAAFNGATLLPGETYSAAGSFIDPGADAWSATVNYGDASAAIALALSGNTFALSHQYNTAGTYTVTVVVSDDDAGVTKTATVVVLSTSNAASNLLGAVDQLLTDGKLSNGNAASMSAKLDAAKMQIEAGKNTAAVNQLEAFTKQVDSMVKTGKLSAADGQALVNGAGRLIASLNR